MLPSSPEQIRSAGLLLMSLAAANSELGVCQQLGLIGGLAALPSSQACSL